MSQTQELENRIKELENRKRELEEEIKVLETVGLKGFHGVFQYIAKNETTENPMFILRAKVPKYCIKTKREPSGKIIGRGRVKEKRWTQILQCGSKEELLEWAKTFENDLPGIIEKIKNINK